MKKYTSLLLDVDDTLLDFQANEHVSLGILFEKMNVPLVENTRKLYNELNKNMWKQYEKNEITKETLLNTRFQILFEKIGQQIDGVKAESIYREALGNGAQLIDGAIGVCKRLSQDYNLHIVTNGLYQTQIQRLKTSGLDQYVKQIFVSEAIGHMKPSKEFFSFVFSHLPEESPEQMLIIGDSLSSDMLGGNNAGIDTCWFNPNKMKNQEALVTYEISSLYDLYKILL